MKCEICGRELPINSRKNGVQYYYCRHCKKSYSDKKREPNHHIFEEYIARLMYGKCVSQKNDFTQTQWTINQVAKLLGWHHRDIKKWAKNKELQTISKKKFVEYLEKRENGFDILCVLGFRTASAPSENLNRIIQRKKRAKNDKRTAGFHISETEYLRLVNMPITSRKEAIFVLGALLGCRTSEIIGAKYGDIDYAEKTICFHRSVTFHKNIEISENNFYISNRMYPLTDRMVKLIEWLKSDSEQNRKLLGNKFNSEYSDFLCVKENGDFISSFILNHRTTDICDKANIMSEYIHIRTTKDGERNEKLFGFQFKWLRYTVKLMMLKSGVSENDIRSIFGYKTDTIQETNQLEIMRNAYNILDEYISKNTTE